MCFKTAACINHCAGRAFVPVLHVCVHMFVPVCARVRAYVRVCVLLPHVFSSSADQG